MTDPNPHASDLDQLAYQYVLDELAGEELVAFERRLDTDQAARDSVVLAVETVQATWQALERQTVQPSPSPATSLADRSGRDRRIPYVWVAAAAAVVMVAAVWGAVIWSPVSNGEQSADAAVAEIWADVLVAELPAELEVGRERELDTELIDWDQASWMVVALSELGEDVE